MPLASCNIDCLYTNVLYSVLVEAESIKIGFEAKIEVIIYFLEAIVLRDFTGVPPTGNQQLRDPTPSPQNVIHPFLYVNRYLLVCQTKYYFFDTEYCA